MATEQATIHLLRLDISARRNRGAAAQPLRDAFYGKTTRPKVCDAFEYVVCLWPAYSTRLHCLLTQQTTESSPT
jgi:hypothetical protein